MIPLCSCPPATTNREHHKQALRRRLSGLSTCGKVRTSTSVPVTEGPGSRKSSDSRTAFHRQFSSNATARLHPGMRDVSNCEKERQIYSRRRLGEGEGVGKASWNPRAISACAVADGTPSGVLPLKIVSQCREQAGKVYNVAVFEIEQEIPIQIGLVLWGGGGIAVQRRKLRCQKRGEITRYSSPARLDLASPGLTPTYASLAGRLQRGSG